MHLDIYRCDRKRCREEKPAEYGAGGWTEMTFPRPPDGWLSLKTHRDGLGQEFTFCSLACLAIWARAERKEKP